MGILSSYVIGERTFIIVNGPSRFGTNLGLVTCCFKLWALSQTLSPLEKGEKGLRVRRAITCRASSWAASASSRAAVNSFSRNSTAGTEVEGRMVGRAMGSYPIIKKNGDLPVME